MGEDVIPKKRCVGDMFSGRLNGGGHGCKGCKGRGMVGEGEAGAKSLARWYLGTCLLLHRRLVGVGTTALKVAPVP